MDKLFGNNKKSAAKQTGLFGKQPKTNEGEDMEVDQGIISKANEKPKYVPWVEK